MWQMTKQDDREVRRDGDNAGAAAALAMLTIAFAVHSEHPGCNGECSRLLGRALRLGTGALVPRCGLCLAEWTIVQARAFPALWGTP